MELSCLKLYLSLQSLIDRLYNTFAKSLESLSISITSFILLILDIEELFKVFSTTLAIERNLIFFSKIFEQQPRLLH